MAAVRRAELLDRSGLVYVPRMLVLGVMTGGGVLAFLWLGRSWWQVALAAYSAVVFTQPGFLGHDAGHQQIFRDRRWNDRVDLPLSNLGVGLSYGMPILDAEASHDFFRRQVLTARNIKAGFVGSYAQVLRYLDSVRSDVRPAGDRRDSPLGPIGKDSHGG